MEKIHKMFRPKVSIYGMGCSIPTLRLTSDEVEKKIQIESIFSDFRKNIIFQISGTYTRYFASADENASTLAAEASKNALLDASLGIEDIDCIIFASASQDVIEPATANIIQILLGSTAPVFDVKNACNSFLNGIQVARSFIISGQYKNILICSGETPSRAIRWSTKDREEFKDSLAGYSLGDGGVAMILGKKKPRAPEIIFTEFLSKGQYHDASTIAGGGSISPRNIDKLYFRSDSRRLAEAFNEGIYDFTKRVLRENRWSFSTINFFLPHIVSRYSKEVFREMFSISDHQILNHNSTHGNMASCSIPFAFIEGKIQNKFSSGDRILMVGLGAGASYGLIGIELP